MSADAADPIAGIASELEAVATAFVREHRLPGVAVGVVHGDRLAWSAGVGFADIAAHAAPGTATLYRIASITKTFTATAIMQLRDEGRLHLDDPAVAHLPELHRAESPFGAIETVTLRRLLSHESGLIGDPPDTDWNLPVYQGDPAANLARAPELGTSVPPNTQQKYSNIGYQLLGEVVTRVSGVPYAEYLQANVLDPLGLSGTGFEPFAADLEARRATGYAPRRFSDDLTVSVDPPATQAEGGLWSCVDDLARWISFQLREDGGAREGAQVLAGPTLAEMHRPRYLGDEAWTEAWAIGWYAVRKDDVTWVQHAGGLHGFITNVCFDPKERVGAIALINGDGDAPELAMALGAAARTAVRAAPRPIEPPAPLPSAWADLLGLYDHPAREQPLRVEWRDGKLTLIGHVDAGTPTTLRPADRPDAFVIDPGVREAGEPCEFVRRADGRVRAVRVGPEVLHRLAPVDDL